jgi:hypothetical protein
MEKYEVFNLNNYEISITANNLKILISIRDKILFDCYDCIYTCYDFNIDPENDYSLNLINIYNMIKNGLLKTKDSTVIINTDNCRENQINLILNVDHEYIKFNYIFRVFRKL